jgi:hypothetical protein
LKDPAAKTKDGYKTLIFVEVRSHSKIVKSPEQFKTKE